MAMTTRILTRPTYNCSFPRVQISLPRCYLLDPVWFQTHLHCGLTIPTNPLPNIFHPSHLLFCLVLTASGTTCVACPLRRLQALGQFAMLALVAVVRHDCLKMRILSVAVAETQVVSVPGRHGS